MDSINDLSDLLMFDVQNLFAAEQQLMQLMPSIIEKVHHNSLKNALTHHHNLTQEQIKRLQKIAELLNVKKGNTGNEHLADLSLQTNKGMEGLIAEARQLLEMKLAEEVTDAAIIACVQKMEHYEICAYGTARAYANQLQLHKAEELLGETLNEEYDADDLLTALATAALNKEAVPEGMEFKDEPEIDIEPTADEQPERPARESISERTVHSPGGRAGTSHRRYTSGESRGH